MAVNTTTRDSQNRWGTQPGPIPDSVEILAEISSIDGSQWKLSLHPFSYKRDHNPDLSELLENSTGNLFFNPAFLAASRDRVTHSTIFQLIVWEIAGNQNFARMAIPVIHKKRTFWLPEHMSSLNHAFAPLGDPLIDLRAQEMVMERFNQLLKLAFEKEFPPLLLQLVSEESSLFELNLSGQGNPYLASHFQGQRASLNASANSDDLQLTSKKRLRELNRLLRKFQDLGDVTFEKVSSPFDVILRFEEFLLLETRGWKGKQGSSIHTIKRDAAFARQAVNDLAKEGKSAIFTMRLDDKVVASTILFMSQGKFFPWKTTFDDAYSKFSPGSQLMLKLSEEMLQTPGFVCADSLAKFGTSWMSHLWPHEIRFKTLVFSADSKTGLKISDRLQFKESVKSVIKKMLGRD